MLLTQLPDFLFDGSIFRNFPFNVARRDSAFFDNTFRRQEVGICPFILAILKVSGLHPSLFQ